MQHILAEVVRNNFRIAGVEHIPSILVVGDLMLDRYLWGNVERISPEAPVPIVRLTEETARLGGAGNVAANVAGLGVNAILAGYIGDDEDGIHIKRLLAESGVSADYLVTSQALSTTSKTRIIGGHQQILRLDREQNGGNLLADRNKLISGVLSLFHTQPPHAVILSDYAKGVLDNEVCQSIITAARKLKIPVLVDPKGSDYSKYHGATVLTPNKKEASDFLRTAAHDIAHLLESGIQLLHTLELTCLVITRGEEGISLISATGIEHLPATAQQVFDVSGAGDTVISVLAAGFAANLDPNEACNLANIAAGIVVGKIGTAPIHRDELLQSFGLKEAVRQAGKICSIEGLLPRIKDWRRQGQKIVFTNGCFDLLHVGHVSYLEQARKLGDRLVVGLNTDRSIRALKGNSRPVIGENDRARVLAALEAVDAVVLFDEDTPLQLINAVRPDFLVKGSDYSQDQVVGANIVMSWGGRVELIELVPFQSTSNIISRITER